MNKPVEPPSKKCPECGAEAFHYTDSTISGLVNFPAGWICTKNCGWGESESNLSKPIPPCLPGEHDFMTMISLPKGIVVLCKECSRQDQMSPNATICAKCLARIQKFRD